MLAGQALWFRPTFSSQKSRVDVSGYPNPGVGGFSTGLARIVDAAATFGVKGDNSTDNTTALQAAINAAPFPLAGLSGNDVPAAFVWLPPGRVRVSGTLSMPANVTLVGHGPSGTYLIYTAASGAAIQLATGAEVQIGIRDLGIIATNAAAGPLIYLQQTGGASILGDTRHVIENVVVVGGESALYSGSATECRFDNFSAYRQSPVANHAAVEINGTDHMVSRVTVAQTQYTGTPGGSALRAGTANTRFENIKIFGGSATTVGQMQAGFYMSGNAGRNQIIGLEVQDYPAYYPVEDDGGRNVYLGGVIDSCQVSGMSVTGAVVVRGMQFVNRGGGSFVMPSCVTIAQNVGADIDCFVTSVASVLNTPGTGTGNRILVYGVLQ